MQGNVMQAQPEVLQQGFWDMLKAGDFKGMVNHIKSAPINWVEMGTWLGIGFLLGFLSKKYLQHIIIMVVIGTIVLITLDRFQFIVIQWDAIRNVLHIQSTQQQGMPTLVHVIIEWVKINVSIVVTASVGFVIGWLVG